MVVGLVWAVASALKTEKFYDILGSVAFASTAALTRPQQQALRTLLDGITETSRELNAGIRRPSRIVESLAERLGLALLKGQGCAAATSA